MRRLQSYAVRLVVAAILVAPVLVLTGRVPVAIAATVIGVAVAVGLAVPAIVWAREPERRVRVSGRRYLASLGILAVGFAVSVWLIDGQVLLTGIVMVLAVGPYAAVADDLLLNRGEPASEAGDAAHADPRRGTPWSSF